MSEKKTAYILHGCCDRDEYYDVTAQSPSNSHWIPWLQKQLLMKGYDCQTPEMPTPYAPVYEEWLAIFDRLYFDEHTSLIAHSCGAGFLLKWLNKSGAKIDKLVLVAPWTDPDRYLGNFLQARLRPNLMENVNALHVFYSKDEPVNGVQETIDMLSAAYPDSKLHTFDDYGHFTLAEMDTEKFPELLKVVNG